MRSLLACVAALALKSVAMACPPISVYPQLSGNVTISNTSYFAFRVSSAEVVNFPTIFPFLGTEGLGVYSSYSVANAPASGQEVDVIAARLAAGTGVFPTAAIAWFDAKDNYNVTIGNFSINATVNAGVFASAMSTIFYEAFEFQDTNGDGSYTPNVDVVVSTQSLGSLWWNNMCEMDQPGNPLTIFNITSQPPLSSSFQFGIQTYLSDVIGLMSNGALITPRTMKIDLGVNDYQYKDTVNNTYLALSAYILSAQANASVSAAFNAATSVAAGSGDAEMSFSWDANALVDGNTAQVQASGLADANLAGIGLAADFFFNGLAGASVDVKKIYFSFPTVRPRTVFWDPTMGAGVPPQTVSNSSSSISHLALGLGLGLGIVALIAISYLTFRYCKKRADSENETESLVNNTAYSRTADI